jgi:hypothetical protein
MPESQYERFRQLALDGTTVTVIEPGDAAEFGAWVER